jgi:predicted phage gp36 major capsid-like protein
MQTLVLNVPDDIYQDWKREAESSNRSVEDSVIEMMATSRPKPVNKGGVNPELLEKLESMEKWDTEKLKQVLAKTFSSRKSRRSQTLSFKRGREGLTQQEQDEVKQIIAEQHEFMLVRGKAMSLLAKRGVNIETLLVEPK